MSRQFDTYDGARQYHDAMVRDRTQYGKFNSEIRKLEEKLKTGEPSPEQREMFEYEIGVYTRARDNLERTFPEKYEVGNIKDLATKIREFQPELERLQSQEQQQDPFQQAAQDSARLEYMEKCAKTIEAAQELADKMKKNMELMERGEYSRQQEMEARKDFEDLQWVNHEMEQSRQRLEMVMAGRLPQNQGYSKFGERLEAIRAEVLGKYGKSRGQEQEPSEPSR